MFVTKKINLLFNSIFNQSIKNNRDHTSDKCIKLFINMVLICMCFGLLLSIADVIKYTTITNNLKGHLNLLVMYVTVLLINYYGYYKLAATIFIFYLIFGFFLFSSILTPNIFAEFNLIIIPCIALMLFRKLLIPILSLVVSFITFCIVFLYYANYENKAHFPEYAVLFTSLFVIVAYFKKNNIQHERLLINEKKTIEKQAKELKKLNKFKSHFFINLSHEIRTPITLVKGYVAKIKLNENDKNTQHLQVVNSQIKQIENILNNILDLSKLDAHKLKLRKNNTNISSLLNKHFTDFKELFNKKNIQFSLDNTVGDITVDIDIDLMSKSISNLLHNALKFTSENGTVAISVFLDDNLQVIFTDNGIGIPPKDISKIFERFYQSKNDITKNQGSGIGLSFVKSIIDAHGFTISVKSNPHIKTEFKITIPKKHITISTQNTSVISNEIHENNLEEISNLKIPSEKPTILVVEDHEQMRSYIKSLLQSYHVIEAENGEEALIILKNKTIDLLITDYMMPVMNGEELVKNVKKLNLKIPVIVLTARVDEFSKLSMLRIGVDGYLNKPFVKEELLLFVKNSLKAHQNIISYVNTLDHKEKDEINKQAQEFNKKITVFIIANISNANFGVQDVANHFEVSKSTLNRKVKSILGQTTQQLITQTKIEKARELQLKNPDMPQKKIANAVGMSNTAHLFKKLSDIYGKHYL